MKRKELKEKVPFNIQFFAENDDSSNENSGGENSEEKGKDGEDSENEDSEDTSEKKKKSGEKLFTQRQVNAMMTREKREGKKSILKTLGFESEEEAEKAVKLFKALTDSQKSDEEKNKEGNKKLENEKSDALKRAELAESKLVCLTNGVDKDSIDDVLSIAITKVDDENTLEDVIKGMKKDKRYSAFFTTSNSGTGSSPGHSVDNSGNKKGSIGKRLGESTKLDVKKSSYF